MMSLVLWAGVALAPPGPPAGDESFWVAPVTTELQRAYFAGVRRPNTVACVLVDGDLAGANGVRWADLDFDAMRVALAPLRQGKAPVVVFSIPQSSSEPKAVRNLLRWALVGFGHELGYSDVGCVAKTDGRYNWRKSLNDLIDKGGDGSAPEPVTAGGGVSVAPVRTPLSRHLFDRADCVVTIDASFAKGSDGALEPAVEAAIRERVAALKLARKEKLLFRVGFKEGTDGAAAQFHRGAAKSLDADLGFADFAVQSGLVR